ncbi:MAG: lytic murein transglycosylase [Kiloniellaceae bacterium]
MGPRGSWISRTLCIGLAVLFFAVAGPAASAERPDFAAWLEGVKHDAAAAGISRATIESALSGLEPIERVLELDRRQPEFTQTFWTYLDKRVTAKRVERARRLLARHRALLAKVATRYGVQPRFLVAFWGLESNFGEYTGGFPVIAALATLAYDARRGEFFRAQLLDALRIVDQGHVTPAGMQGSWAGAVGQVQFIPSTFVRYAVDFDGDGRRDLWNSLPDVFASAANYLSAIGWRGGETWGREVRLPPGFDWEQANLEVRKPLAEWQRLGVRRMDGRDLPRADMTGAVVLPAGHKGPAFLVYRNFDAILAWNRSILYALAVGHLADRIAGAAPLMSRRPPMEQPLSRSQIEELQSLLGSLGFDPGTPDGVVGSRTRAALKAYQRQAQLAPDGYPTAELLQGLRQRAERQAQSN